MADQALKSIRSSETTRFHGWKADADAADPSLYLSDLQNFVTTHSLNRSFRGQLKLWLSQFALDPATFKQLKNYFHHQIIDSGAIGHSLDPQTIDDGAIGISVDPQTIDEGAIGHCQDCGQTGTDLVAVPEPSTVNMFVCGVGLLGGVLLRFRSGRQRHGRCSRFPQR